MAWILTSEVLEASKVCVWVRMRALLCPTRANGGTRRDARSLRGAAPSPWDRSPKGTRAAPTFGRKVAQGRRALRPSQAAKHRLLAVSFVRLGVNGFAEAKRRHLAALA